MRRHLLSITRSPIFFGGLVGALAVAVQLALMPGRGAYGLCTVCHTRDALAWFVLELSDAKWLRALVQPSWPLFTTIGITLGALAAAWRHGEFRPLPASRPLRMLLLGLGVGMTGLIVMSCPTRLFLRLSYADPFALPALAGLVAGTYAATALIRRW